MAFDQPTFKPSYNVLFHYNNYKGFNRKWACFANEKKRDYFNGTTKLIGYGKDIYEAYEDYKHNEQSRNNTS